MEHPEIRARIETFASLQAAHRALARSVHPAEMAAEHQRAQELLIAFRELQEQASHSDPETARSTDQALTRIDALLAEQTQRTLGIVMNVEISQLRATIPKIALEHPSEVQGLIDVLLAGNLDDEKTLRILEYLITVLSTEERDGRRVVVADPAEVTARLRESTRELAAEASDSESPEEQVLNAALEQLLSGQDPGDHLDRVRRCKTELGRSILRPSTLSTAVSYNAAVSNRVAGQIDESRSIELLTESLLARVPETEAAAAGSASMAILGGSAFTQVVSALCARVAGGSAPADDAGRLVEGLRLDMLTPGDIEALGESDDGEPGSLMRWAVTLGLLIRQRDAVEVELHRLGLDPDVLEVRSLRGLVEEMTAAARKLFADSRYTEAFQLSEVKTRNLAGLAATRGAAGGAAPLRRVASARPEPSVGWLGAVLNLGDWTAKSWLAILAFLALGVIVAFALALPSGNYAKLGADELRSLSPFLISGHQQDYQGVAGFHGRIGATWDYLETDQRQKVAGEIAQRLEARGITDLILMGEGNRVLARYVNGELLEFAEAAPGGP